MDGVIVDDIPYHLKAWKEFSKLHKVTITPEVVKRINGHTNRDIFRFFFGSGFPASKIEEYARLKERLFRKIYNRHVRPVPGLRGFLKTLNAAGIKIALATSAPRENARFILKNSGLKNFFPIIVDESMIIRGKPDPEVYLKAAKALKVSPKNCLVFEDAVAGIAAARSAGAKVAGLTTTHSKKQLSGADLHIRNFQNLKIGRLKELFQTSVEQRNRLFFRG